MRKVIYSFDVVVYSFSLKSTYKPHRPPERADTVSVVTIVPIHSTIGVDVTNVASCSI